MNLMRLIILNPKFLFPISATLILVFFNFQLHYTLAQKRTNNTTCEEYRNSSPQHTLQQLSLKSDKLRKQIHAIYGSDSTQNLTHLRAELLSLAQIHGLSLHTLPTLSKQSSQLTHITFTLQGNLQSLIEFLFQLEYPHPKAKIHTLTLQNEPSSYTRYNSKGHKKIQAFVHLLKATSASNEKVQTENHDL